MPHYTKSDFADLAGIHAKHISTMFRRGKIVYDGDLIDSDNPINAEFLRLKQSGTGQRGRPAKSNVETISIDFKQKTVEFEQKQPVKPVFNGKIGMKMPGLFKNQAKEQDVKSQNDSNAARFDVDTRIKEMQLAKTQIEIEIQAIKKQKITGAVIPTDSVIPAFKQQNLHMMKSFKYTLDDFVREVALLAGLDNNTIAMLKGKVVASVNNAGDKALNDGIKSIDKIIELYSNARGQGERT